MTKKLIELTLILNNDTARIEYYEPESSDFTAHEFDYSEAARHYCNHVWDAEKKIGREIFDWFALMKEEENA